MGICTSGDEAESVFEAVAGAVDGEHVGVVEEAVEDGGGGDVVAEDAAGLPPESWRTSLRPRPVDRRSGSRRR
jgi:hypothetical protein